MLDSSLVNLFPNIFMAFGYSTTSSSLIPFTNINIFLLRTLIAFVYQANEIFIVIYSNPVISLSIFTTKLYYLIIHYLCLFYNYIFFIKFI